MKKTCEDAHELDTLDSLRTASSETLRLDSVKEPLFEKNLPRNCEECQKLSPEQRRSLLGTISTAMMTRASVPEAMQSLLVELSRTKLYGSNIHQVALELMFREMDKGRVDGFARALVALPLEDIQAFIVGLSVDERSKWRDRARMDLRATSLPPTTSFWYALIKAMAEARDTLDSARALRLALLCGYDRKPFALLFHSDSAELGVDNVGLALNYLRASYNDCLPQVREGDPNPQESDLVLEVYAAYFSVCSKKELSTVLDRIIVGITPNSLRAFRAHDFQTLLEAAPFLRTRLPSANDPDNGFHGRISTINQHPASPYLLFALRLATWSGAARAGLVERGIVKAIEGLYDMDETVVDTDYGERVVSGISQHIMVQLCYLVLGALANCYDPSRSTLMEELRADIVAYSRSMSRRFFAPEVWEIRDD